MTVHPGFGGQPFRADMMESEARRGMEPDGGEEDPYRSRRRISPETARVSIANGANVLVAGTSIFHTKDTHRRSASCGVNKQTLIPVVISSP